jgi:hypothetical protein
VEQASAFLLPGAGHARRRAVHLLRDEGSLERATWNAPKVVLQYKLPAPDDQHPHQKKPCGYRASQQCSRAMCSCQFQR